MKHITVDVSSASSISDITHRKGLLQSQVSAAVEKLRELWAVRTESDPADGRRTLVWVTRVALRRAARIGVEEATVTASRNTPIGRRPSAGG